MRTLYILVLLSVAQVAIARTIVVDPNGPIKSVQQAVNLAVDGDTIKVLPGVYEEQIVVNKNVLIMGSGYENTIFTGSFDPVVDLQGGILQWVRVSSTKGDGIHLRGGAIVRNVVVINNPDDGITILGVGKVINCVVIHNAHHGIITDGNSSDGEVINTISAWNRDRSYFAYRGNLRVLYSITYDDGYGEIYGNFVSVELYDTDPRIKSRWDVHLTADSPAIDAGHPSYQDPDGTRSDIGYFGGPHAPVYPVITEVILLPQEDGSIKVKVSGRANW